MTPMRKEMIQDVQLPALKDPQRPLDNDTNMRTVIRFLRLSNPPLARPNPLAPGLLPRRFSYILQRLQNLTPAPRAKRPRQPVLKCANPPSLPPTPRQIH